MSSGYRERLSAGRALAPRSAPSGAEWRRVAPSRPEWLWAAASGAERPGTRSGAARMQPGGCGHAGTARIARRVPRPGRVLGSYRKRDFAGPSALSPHSVDSQSVHASTFAASL